MYSSALVCLTQSGLRISLHPEVNFMFRVKRARGVYPKYLFTLSHHLSLRGRMRQPLFMDLALGNTDRISVFFLIWLLFVVCLLFCFYPFYDHYILFGSMLFPSGLVLAFWPHWSMLRASFELVMLTRRGPQYIFMMTGAASH